MQTQRYITESVDLIAHILGRLSGLLPCFFNLYSVSKSYYFIFWAKSLEAAMQKGYSRNRQGKTKYRKRREGGRTQERRREEKGGEARTEKDYEQTEDS